MDVTPPSFHELLEANKLIDLNAELVVEEKSIKVHRGFLTSISPVFSAMFSQPTTEAKTGKVVITDMTYNTVKLSLDFCAGKHLSTKSPVDWVGVYTFADKYDIAAVREKLGKCFNTAKITRETFAVYTLYAFQFSNNKLIDRCAKFLAYNPDVVLLSEFQKIGKDVIVAVLAKASAAYCNKPSSREGSDDEYNSY
uniref:BTB domain-containing protein n=1 Tax=Panagrellus redivivus TaxID=6233 RepID=A0A7E4VKN1_PANRE